MRWMRPCPKDRAMIYLNILLDIAAAKTKTREKKKKKPWALLLRVNSLTKVANIHKQHRVTSSIFHPPTTYLERFTNCPGIFPLESF